MAKKVRIIAESDKYSLNLLLPPSRVIPFCKKLKKEHQKREDRHAFLTITFETNESDRNKNAVQG